MRRQRISKLIARGSQKILLSEVGFRYLKLTHKKELNSYGGPSCYLHLLYLALISQVFVIYMITLELYRLGQTR